MMRQFSYLHLTVVLLFAQQFGQILVSCADHKPSSNTNPLVNRTTKPTRTIQRLTAGYIQNTVSPKSVDRRNTTRKFNLSRFTKDSNAIAIKKIENKTAEIEDDNDDAALLEDDNWDNGILTSSAGEGRENDNSTKAERGKKTLADQVAEGKYGLIETELFQNRPTQPGILSYHPNEEFPNDNAKNLGGLKKDDIWLSEEHLLVLKGGELNTDDPNEPWEPIDDYQAPSRQIKIPSNPKVPPPFPVQFEDNGPLQFIGDYKFSFFSPLSDEALPFFAGDVPPNPNGNNKTYLPPRPGPNQNAAGDKMAYIYNTPQRPWLIDNQTLANPFAYPFPPTLNGAGPGPGPPPNPFGDGFNGTDYDEDDPSLFYPPPYSFVYESSYNLSVPPGPLVPGIVLPPPPNSFARLEEDVPKLHTPQQKKKHKEVPFNQILANISKDQGISNLQFSKGTAEKSIPPTTPRPRVYPSRYKSNSVQILRPVPSPAPPPLPRPVTKYPDVRYLPQVPPTTPSPPVTTTTLVPSTALPTPSFLPGNPVYFEYFDARNAINNTNIHKLRPIVVAQPDLYNILPESVRQFHKSKTVDPSVVDVKNNQNYQNINYIPVTPRNPQNSIVAVPNPNPQNGNFNYRPKQPAYQYNEYLPITPRPILQSNDYFTLPFKQTTQQPIDSFTRQVEQIHKTLQFFKSSPPKPSSYQRLPKAKAVYEYSFDARLPSTHVRDRVPAPNLRENFQPPPQLDPEPFKPMLPYSPPSDDANSFTGIATTGKQGEYYYESTVRPTQVPATTSAPIQVGYTYKQSGVNPPQFRQKISPDISPPAPRKQPEWYSVEKQVLQEVPQQYQQQTAAGWQNRGRSSNFQQPDKKYYQYSTEIPFARHLVFIKNQNGAIVAHQRAPYNAPYGHLINLQQRLPVPVASYRQPPPRPAAQQQQQQQYPQQVPQSLHSDILVNYRHPLPFINPDSEYINPHPQVSNINRNPPYFRERATNSAPATNNNGGQSSDPYYYSQRQSRRKSN